MKSMLRRGVSLMIVLVVTAAGIIQTRANPTDWASVSDPEIIDSSAGYENTDTTPSKDNLCEGTNGIPFGGDPSWTPVSGQSNPLEAARAFVEAHGQIFYGPTDVGNGRGGVFVTHTDIDNNHWTHDVNVFVTLDKDSRALLGDGNFNTTEYATNEVAALELEWENGGVPRFAFPAPGDRITVWGNHIWDCGHGSPNDFRTEIHPPVGWVLYRQSADEDGLPSNGRQNQNPWVWYESGDRRGIGETLPATGLNNTPVQASVADVFFSTFGALAIANLNGCNDETLINDDTENATCYELNGENWAQPLRSRDYSFFVPAPPKDGGEPGDAVLVWDSEDRCAEIPGNPGNPAIGDVERDGLASSGDDAFNIGSPTCNIPDEVQQVTENGQPGIRVTVRATQASNPANSYIGYGKRWKVAWDYVRPEPQRVKTFQVNFDQLRVWDDAEECSNDGEWLMGVRVNEQWAYPVRGSGDDGAPFWEDGALDDNDCPLEGGGSKNYGFGGLSFTTHIGPWQKINVWEWSWEDDTVTNDVLPAINTDETGPGTFVRGIASGEPEGGHQIQYTISDTTPPVPSAGSLTIGNPQYGPNADTGGSATRIAGSTPLDFTGSNAQSLQFQYWPEGQGPGRNWSVDGSGPLQASFAADAPDGIYTILYAPVSDQGIVGERNRVSVQLDRTAPILTVPANIVVDATDATGTVVNYEVSASDNLPGPVSSSCDLPSGSFFPIRTVTTVTCTASDAVGNSTTQSFTIEVVSPFGYIPDFVLLASEWVRVDADGAVQSGNVGAFDASQGAPPALNGVEVEIGDNSTLTGGSQIAAHSAQLGSGVQAGDVFTLDPVIAGAGAVFTPKLGYVPLFLGMPTVPVFSAGGSNLTLRGNTTLAAGTYGKLDVKPNAVVTLTGGNYYFTEIDIGSRAELRFSAPAIVHVTGRMDTRNNVQIGPVGGVSASDIVFYVLGTNPTPGKQALELGNNVQVSANLYAPNGTLKIGQDAVLTGAFLGRGVDVGRDATLNLDSAFDYP